MSIGITITNYTTAVRENVDYNGKGIQTPPFVLDSIGVPTAYVDTYLVKNDKQTFTMPLAVPYDYTPTKDIKKIEGDSSELTITHTDDSTVVVTTA